MRHISLVCGRYGLPWINWIAAQPPNPQSANLFRSRYHRSFWFDVRFVPPFCDYQFSSKHRYTERIDNLIPNCISSTVTNLLLISSVKNTSIRWYNNSKGPIKTRHMSHFTEHEILPSYLTA